MEKMSKKKFIRLVMSAANEVVKHFSEGTKTIEAEIPSGTKNELVSIVVSGRRGYYETFHGIKRMPVFISTRLTLNGAQGEIVFWGNDVPPELRDLTAKELSKKGYQIGPCAADDRPFSNWVRSFHPWQSELRDFLEEELGKGGEVCGLNRDENGNYKIDFYDGTSKLVTPDEFEKITNNPFAKKEHPLHWPMLRFLHPDRWAEIIEKCGRQYAYSHCV